MCRRYTHHGGSRRSRVLDKLAWYFHDTDTSALHACSLAMPETPEANAPVVSKHKGLLFRIK